MNASPIEFKGNTLIYIKIKINILGYKEYWLDNSPYIKATEKLNKTLKN